MAVEASDPTEKKEAKPRKRSKTERDPFEVELKEDQENELVRFLVRELEYGEQARDSIVGDDNKIDRAHLMYEGGDGELTKNTPWPGAANLGSFVVTEKVDSMRARITATIQADPIWLVEGYGGSAERAPIVEEFHQWKAEETRLQQFLGRCVHNSLVEGTGVLEVSDRVQLRKGRRKISALIQQSETDGSAMIGDDGKPILVKMANGRYVEAEENEPAQEMLIDDVVRATNGPSYRVLSLKNFFVLPGHASEKEDVWGYAKRFWRRLGDLKCREREGFYKNVDALGDAQEREQTPEELRAGQDVAPSHGDNAEKELWEVTFLADLDDDGYEEWYVATISTFHRVLLRIQYQDYGTPHYVLFTPFPRPNSIYGYSYAFDKLGSLYDEHTALRNMFMDRASLAVSAPFLLQEGSPWNPARRPFGPGKTIPVRDMNEIKQLEIKDVPQSIPLAMQAVISAAERISGQNDTTTGHLAQQDRTLGEVRLATEQSFVRIDEAVKNYQEGMEELFDLLQIIWTRKLEDEPEQLPGEMVTSMREFGVQIPSGLMTANLLRGTFRGKPHSSVESADYLKMRVDFGQMMTALTQLAQAVPAFQQHLNNPQVARSIMSQIARIYRWPDRKNLVASFTGAPQLPPMMPQQQGQPGTNAAPPQLPASSGLPLPSAA